MSTHIKGSIFLQVFILKTFNNIINASSVSRTERSAEDKQFGSELL